MADEHGQEQWEEGQEQRGEDGLDEGSGEQTGESERQGGAAGGGGVGVPLLRFSQLRDPAVIARWLRTRVIQPDSEVWLAGYVALREWVARQGDAQVPTGALIELEDREGAYPVGRWVSEQRRALSEGVLRPHRWELLDELGMLWDVADARFQNGIVAARAYHAEFGTLCAPRDAVVDGFAVGQWLENLRKGVMTVTEARDAALREIDGHWNPEWAVSWQRRYAALAYLVEGEDSLPEVPPGVRVHGIDVGTWLARQTSAVGWAQLAAGQRQLLERLGVPAPVPAGGGDGAGAAGGGAPARVPGLKGLDAFGRGLAAARQYLHREGHLTVPRKHEELLHPAGGGDVVAVRLGVWLTNQKTRRAKLSEERRAALAGLGLRWVE